MTIASAYGRIGKGQACYIEHQWYFCSYVLCVWRSPCGLCFKLQMRCVYLNVFIQYHMVAIKKRTRQGNIIRRQKLRKTDT